MKRILLSLAVCGALICTAVPAMAGTRVVDVNRGVTRTVAGFHGSRTVTATVHRDFVARGPRVRPGVVTREHVNFRVSVFRPGR